MLHGQNAEIQARASNTQIAIVVRRVPITVIPPKDILCSALTASLQDPERIVAAGLHAKCVSIGI